MDADLAAAVRTYRPTTYLGLGGAAGVIVGPFLPWAAVRLGGGAAVLGIEHLDGVLALWLGIVVAAALAARIRRPAWVAAAGLLALLIAGRTVLFPLDVELSGYSVTPAVARPGTGAYVSALGGLVVVLAALLEWWLPD